VILNEQRARFAGSPVVVYTVDDMRDIPSDWRPRAFDTEGTGLQQWHPDWRLRLCQLGDTDVAYVVPAERYRPGREQRTWAHNASFDALSLHWAGMGITELYDSEILCKLADPRGFERADYASMQTVRMFGLKYMIRQHLDPEYDSDKMLYDRFAELGYSKSEGYAKIDLMDPIYTLYSGLDVIAVSRLVRHLGGRLTPKQRELFKYEHRLQHTITIPMSRRGMNVDEDAKQEALRQLDIEHSQHAEWLEQNNLPLDTRKTDDRGAWIEFLTGHDVELPQSKKTGAYSLDKKRVMKALAPHDPLSIQRQAWRHIGAAKTARDHPTRYIAKFNGRVYPAIKSMGTVTTRITFTDPPIQQTPTEGPIRPCLCADPGYLLLPADSGQIEFRTAAGLSQDRVMLIACKAEDMYAFVSNLLRNRRDITHNSPERKIDKIALLAHMYGAGAEKLAMIMSCILADAQEWVGSFKQTFAQLAAHFRELSQQDYVELPNGLLIPVDRLRRYAAGNYKMQSTARYLHSDMILGLADEGYADNIWATVHDEIILHLPAEEIPYAQRVVNRVMTTQLNGVPIPVEQQVPAYNWTKG
jgi:DNA polymerase I